MRRCQPESHARGHLSITGVNYQSQAHLRRHDGLRHWRVYGLDGSGSSGADSDRVSRGVVWRACFEVVPALSVQPALIRPKDAGETVGLLALFQERVEELEKHGDGGGVSLRGERVGPTSRSEVPDQDGPAEVMTSTELDNEPFPEPGQHAPGASGVAPQHERRDGRIATIQAMGGRLLTNGGQQASEVPYQDCSLGVPVVVIVGAMQLWVNTDAGRITRTSARGATIRDVC